MKPLLSISKATWSSGWVVDVLGRLLGFNKSCGRAIVRIPTRWYRGREEGGGVGRTRSGEARSLGERWCGEGWVEVGDIVKSKGFVERSPGERHGRLDHSVSRVDWRVV